MVQTPGCVAAGASFRGRDQTSVPAFPGSQETRDTAIFVFVACRSAIVLGSVVPLCMFLSWEAVALNLIPSVLTGVPSEVLPDPAILMEATFHPASTTTAAAAAAAVLPASLSAAAAAGMHAVPAVADAALLAAAEPSLRGVALAVATPAGLDGGMVAAPLGLNPGLASVVAAAAGGGEVVGPLADAAVVLDGTAVDPLEVSWGHY